MIKVAMNQDGKQWDVVRGAEVIATFATIKEAQAARFELSRKPAAPVLYFKQDGTAVTKRPRRRAA